MILCSLIFVITLYLNISEGLHVQGAAGPITVPVGGSVMLPCSVETPIALHELEIEWKRDDSGTLVHLFSVENVRPESQYHTYRGRAHFFAEVDKGNFSLMLENVTAEDEGVYRCIVHTERESAHALIDIKYVGFSNLHIAVVFLCTVALLSCIILTCLAFPRLRDTDRKAMTIHYLLVFLPSTTIFIGFIIWGVIEGFLAETIVCSTVNLVRFLLLFKMAPYSEGFPGMYRELIKRFTTCGEYLIVAILTVTVIYLQWEFARKHYQENIFISIIGVLIVVYPVGTLILKVSLGSDQRRRIPPTYCFLEVSIAFLMLMLVFNKLFNKALGIEFLAISVFKIIACFVCIEMFQKRRTDSLTSAAVLFLILLNAIICVTVWECLKYQVSTRFQPDLTMHFLQILTLLEFFEALVTLLDKTDKSCVIVYLFGAVGLPAVSAIALATELILKSRNGERAVGDLQMIVLPSESVFVCCWLILLMRSYWREQRKGITEGLRKLCQPCQKCRHRDQRSQSESTEHEMEALSTSQNRPTLTESH